MGFFSNRKVVYVSSVIYNLLGLDEPTNYTSNSILDAVINPKSDQSLAENLFNKITAGPAFNFRRYMQWTKRSDYQKHIGLATSTYYNVDFLPNSTVSTLLKKYLNLPSDTQLTVTKSEFGRYNIYVFADIWVVANKPLAKDTNYVVTDKPIYQNPTRPPSWLRPNPIIRYDILITFLDGSSTVIDTTTIDKLARYLFIQYFTDIEQERTYGYLAYKQNSGFQDFDVLFAEPQALENTYSAFLPFRVDNKFISDEEGKEYLPLVYKLAVRGAKLAIGDNKYEELMKSIADNPSINDIDYAYLHFGVPLNIPYDFGKEYLFEFFNNLADYNLEFGTKQNFTNWYKTSSSEGLGSHYVDRYGNYFLWVLLYKTGVPGSIYIRSPGTNINFNITINWDHTVKTVKSGLVNSEAKPGKFYVWYSKDKKNVATGAYKSESTIGNKVIKNLLYDDIAVLHLAHQLTSNRYTEILIWEPLQLNYIYGGKYTATYADQAFALDELSDFIIPIQYNSFLEANAAKMNSTMQCCYNLVFNCYVVKKKRWYQSGVFALIVTIVAIIITVIACIINPALGAAIAKAMAGTVGGVVAGAIAATTAISVAAYVAIAMVINAIVAIILTQVLIAVATPIFGEKIGTIVASIVATFITFNFSNITQGISATAAGVIDSIAANPGLFTASVALQGGNIYAQLLGYKVKSILQQINNLYLSYLDKLEEIQDKTDELLGINPNKDLVLNPLLQSDSYLTYLDRDTFLARTQMVGSLIVDLTLKYIENFVKLTITTSLT